MDIAIHIAGSSADRTLISVLCGRIEIYVVNDLSCCFGGDLCFTADDFTFTCGGAVLETVSGSDTNGNYVEVIMYAYRMCDDISYTVTIDGTTYTESYNIYSYYSYVKSEYADNTALHAIVEQLAAYARSAAEYKASVTEK